MKGHKHMTVLEAETEALQRVFDDPRFPERDKPGSIENINRVIAFSRIYQEHLHTVTMECLEDS